MFHTTSLAIFICGFFISLNVLAKDLEGKIVGVSDGDTATMLVEALTVSLLSKFALLKSMRPKKLSRGAKSQNRLCLISLTVKPFAPKWRLKIDTVG